MREFIDGAEAIARSALHAGCNFFAGYPITPATPILLKLADSLPKNGGIVIQAEDEIAAMGMSIGAAMTGARVMTATSGPGISLYSENIGAAIMGEVPMVIVDCQRMGPATGGATTVAQGDIQFLRWGTSGGFPVIVYAPVNVADCYKLTLKAFDLAERFRLPVFLATDKETILTKSTVETDTFERINVRSRYLASSVDEFIPYHFEKPTDIPPMSPIGGPHIVRFTTSSHDVHGYLTKDPKYIGRINQHLAAKVSGNLKEIILVKSDLQEGATTLIISYGITARSMIEAIGYARKNGVKLSSLTVYSLWPVPEVQVLLALKGIERVIVAELNLGQYRREIERLVNNDQEVVGVNRIDGNLISPSFLLKEGGIHI